MVGRVLGRLPTARAARLRLRLHRLARPARLGALRRHAPFSREFGYDRGTPIDRYYIERFLSTHSQDVRGTVLEVKDSTYTAQFGQDVFRSEVLDVDPSNPHATIIADLAAADAIEDESFDCFILTQTLQFVYDSKSAVRHAHRVLRQGGVLLVTLPIVSPIVEEAGLRDYWRFTPASCRRLFGDVFGPDSVEISIDGNVLSSIAFFAGVAQEELDGSDLDQRDARFPTIACVRAVKR
jgi:SAM-dependent methyltransferase